MLSQKFPPRVLFPVLFLTYEKMPKLLIVKAFGIFIPVEATGFEPTTSASRTQRSTKLSHASILFVF